MDATTIRPEQLAASTEYGLGDRVRAKLRGGPTMVVSEVYSRIYVYRYRCCWQDEVGRERSEVFRFGELVPVD